ncbi:Virion core and cleavage processing protein [Eptesipox virus]|uniref:25 kDa core protein OPG138 n=1 Tax=Eptesipox virus TaxID=1329402 RepID=A0A220T6H3_9POXV|nr:Virion core and cleavage processing protein [Eptesipox virus]ASK51309.1 Virion core and cleavage processing protein [Eptesipox virus]WAH71067.1 virion core and cleavage processing protein [Eptesipox virus]
MADKNIVRSSYDDYYETIKKLSPQLKTILAHINSEQTQHRVVDTTSTVTGGSCPPRKKCSSKPCKTSKKMTSSGCTSAVKRKTMYNNTNEPQIMQAVTNAGKIVYGTIKDGKLEVQGTVGEIDHDLLGVNFVNGGKKPSMTKKPKSTSISSTKSKKMSKSKDCCPTSGMD